MLRRLGLCETGGQDDGGKVDEGSGLLSVYYSRIPTRLILNFVTRLGKRNRLRTTNFNGFLATLQVPLALGREFVAGEGRYEYWSLLKREAWPIFCLSSFFRSRCRLPEFSDGMAHTFFLTPRGIFF